jgi:hypothetical protein
MQEEMKRMMAQKNGAILNLSSVAGKVGVANSSIYSATKHAAIGMPLTECLGTPFYHPVLKETLRDALQHCLAQTELKLPYPPGLNTRAEQIA